jgi:hypothetical protein
MRLILLKPFVFARISAQSQCTIRKSASRPPSNFSSFCRTAHSEVRHENHDTGAG